MTTNGDAASVLVLYKVVNSKSDDGLYNAFRMPRGNAVTLKNVKQNCAALRSLNAAGPEGFHWRVCIEDNRGSGNSKQPVPFSWWDIQDENARLPVKEATPTELEQMFHPSKSSSSSSSSSVGTDAASKAAKGGLKMLGKAVNAMVDVGGADHGPKIGVIAFKLLDLIKMHDEFDHKHHGSTHSTPTPAPQKHRAPAANHRTPAANHRTPAANRSAPPARPAAVPTPARRTTAPPPPRTAPRSAARPAARPQQPAAEASLMNFDTPDTAAGRKTGFQHSASLPANFASETRAQKLKREYEQNKQKQNRVWDDVDQRWVDVGSNSAGGAVRRATTSAPPTNHGSASKKAVKGIKLDVSNAAGKSANVQAAVHKRVTDMRQSQAKAKQDLRDREATKKREEAEEDVVRKRLEPRIKAWSEEHGKKKQLRALLASLHTILWPEANWKQISLGDVLDDSKCKKYFHKASRVVHPDKTHHLDAEKRFLAKRIFDALSQAKKEFDDGKR